MAAEAKTTAVELGALVGGVNLPDSLRRLKVSGVSHDSRSVRPGDLFMAYPGASADGREFIDAAVAQGAVAVLAEASGLSVSPREIPVIPLRNLARRVPLIAARFHGEPARHMVVTGVTGTNGKTTCSQLLAQLIAGLESQCGVVGTLGSGVVPREGHPVYDDTGMTTPDPVRLQAILAGLRVRGVKHVAMEVSSHSLDQGRVSAIPFHTAIFTNLTRDHLDYHGSLEAYANAKLKLFRHSGLQCAVINAADPMASRIKAVVDPSVRVVTYAALADADVRFDDVRTSSTGLRARLTTPWGEAELHSPLLGNFNLANLAAVIAAACAQGFDFDDVMALVPQLRAIPGRMEVVRQGSRPLVVVDYAHTPDALEQVLRALRGHCEAGGQLWCVFGCGGDRDRGKRALMGSVASRNADRLVITSDNPRGEDPQAIIGDILGGVRGTQPQVMADRAAAIAYAVANAGEKDVVVVAGKGHETFQQIGEQRLPFSDLYHARMALNRRGGVE